jgi:hypothetical protein
MNYHAFCLVGMPFGGQSDLKSGAIADFDRIYNQATKPAIEVATEKDQLWVKGVGASSAETLPEAL